MAIRANRDYDDVLVTPVVDYENEKVH